MNIILIKDKLKEGLDIVSRVTGNTNNLPILKNVRIEANDNALVLTTTNLEIAITYSVPGKVIEKGKVTVPVNTLLGLISTIQTDRLNIETKNDKTLEIKTDNYQAKLNILPADDFPLVPGVDTKEYLEFDGEILKEALEQVLPATQMTDLRPELNAILVDFSLNELKFVGTDSSRLAEKTISSNNFSGTLHEEFKILVPLKTAQEIVKIARANEKIKIYKDEHQIKIETKQCEIISRLIEGNFPDYKAVIPKKLALEVQINKEEFLQALKLVGILSARVNEIKIKTLADKKAIEIFSSEDAIGDNHYIMQAKLKGKADEVSFNWRYLSDGLKAVSGEEIYFGINDDNKPALIRDPKDTSYFYILMPILKA